MITVDHPRITAFDTAVEARWAPVRQSRFANRVFYALSEAANHSLLWHGLTWLPVLSGRRRWSEAVPLSLAFGLESAVVNGVIKQAFRRDRPVVDDPRPHRLRQPRSSSFPSGHATSAFFAAAVLPRRPFVLPFTLLAVGVAWSRVHVRIHHPSDVVGGIGLGVALGTMARRALGRR